jgi:hypothetical protein
MNPIKMCIERTITLPPPNTNEIDFAIIEENLNQKSKTLIDYLEKIKIYFESQKVLKADDCTYYFREIRDRLKNYLPPTAKVEALHFVKSIFNLMKEKVDAENINLSGIVLKVLRKFKSADKDIEKWAFDSFVNNLTQTKDNEKIFPIEGGFRAVSPMANGKLISVCIQNIDTFENIPKTSLVDLFKIVLMKKKHYVFRQSLRNYIFSEMPQFPIADAIYLANSVDLKDDLPLIEKTKTRIMKAKLNNYEQYKAFMGLAKYLQKDEINLYFKKILSNIESSNEISLSQRIKFFDKLSPHEIKKMGCESTYQDLLWCIKKIETDHASDVPMVHEKKSLKLKPASIDNFKNIGLADLKIAYEGAINGYKILTRYNFVNLINDLLSQRKKDGKNDDWESNRAELSRLAILIQKKKFCPPHVDLVIFLFDQLNYSDKKFAKWILNKIDFEKLDEIQWFYLLKGERFFKICSEKFVSKNLNKIENDIEKNFIGVKKQYAIDEFFKFKDLPFLIHLIIAFSRVSKIVPDYVMESLIKIILEKTQHSESSEELLNLLKYANFDWMVASKADETIKNFSLGNQFLLEIEKRLINNNNLNPLQFIQAFCRFAKFDIKISNLQVNKILDLVSSMEIWDKIEVYNGLIVLGIEVKQEHFLNFLKQVDKEKWEGLYTKLLVKLFMVTAALFNSDTCPEEIKKLTTLLNKRLKGKPENTCISSLRDCYHILGFKTLHFPALSLQKNTTSNFLQDEVTEALKRALNENVDLKDIKLATKETTVLGRTVDIVIEGENLPRIAIEIDKPISFTPEENRKRMAIVIRKKLHKLAGYSKVWSIPVQSKIDNPLWAENTANSIVEKLQEFLVKI